MVNRQKKRRRLFFLVSALGFLATVAFGLPLERILDTYSPGLSPHWHAKKFAGTTRYTVVEENGRRAIRAESHAAASGLYYEIEYNPKEYPLLRWEWKVANLVSKSDPKTKAGDDYAARVYVIFPSLLFWKTRAINYIWATALPKGEVIPNAYTANAMMLAVESGAEHVGQWRREERNVYEDYRRLFGEAPPEVGAIAIMTDTDNTGENAVAWYGPIAIARTAP